MQPVVIESPFGTRPDGSRASPEEVERNKKYLDACIADCLERGEAPFASHKLYPGVLDDSKPEEREKGMKAGFAIGAMFRKRVFYRDLGTTPGMLAGFEQAILLKQEIEVRHLSWWTL